LFPGKEHVIQAQEYLRDLKWPDKPIVAIAPGSIWATKRWPEEHYTELSRLLEAQKCNLVFIGGPEERKLCSDIIKMAGVNAINIAGKTSILGSAAVIEKCDLIICNDSGALHIANAMQTDVFTFFGPTVQDIGYFPFRENDKVFELNMDCRPCGSHGSNNCKLKHHNCMKNIKPGIVLTAVKNKLC